MKKVFILAIAAFLVSGSAFAHGGGKKCGKSKDCCKKEAKAKGKACCKKEEAKKA